MFTIQQVNAQEWRKFYETTNIDKYRPENVKLGPPAAGENRVVFMGNSITESWPVVRPDFFKSSNYIGRGISGQTTPQMLLRFRTDVISLQPKIVVILAGVNDIAQNTGFISIEMIAENIMTMTELARYHNIEVIICSVLPAIDFPWKRGLEPVNKIIKLNSILKNYAAQNDLTYVDYHSAMKDKDNGLKVPEYTTANDLVHPNEAGYMVMEKLIQPAIEQALAASALTVNALFRDHMVLQQKEKITVWGTALSTKQVKVTGSWGSEATTISDAAGNWKLNLNTPEAGGPYELNITSENKTILLKDILIGEVWLASGQSNMEMPLKGWPPNDPIANSAQEIADAQHPNIRMFTVVNNFSLKEENSVKGNWQVCSPETAGDFSASAYFFARRLHQELNVPIGIIHSSWGGTPAESWVSKTQLKTLGDFDETIKAIEDPERERLTNEWYSQWVKKDIPKNPEDWSNIDLEDNLLAQPEYDDRNWANMKLPGRIDFPDGQDLNGAFWLRKNIKLEDTSSDYTFTTGPIDDTDFVYVNGQKIGATINKYNEARKYSISKSLLKKGINTIAIRVIDTGGPGSINGEMKLSNGQHTISIAGDWKYMFTAELYQNQIYLYDVNKINLLKRPNILSVNAHTPASLYNAMIHPLLPYKIKGAIWYQGESNVGRAKQYQRLFPLMIENWREQWNSNFPFYFVQIAPFQYQNSGDATLDQSQKLRDAQRLSLKTPKTGMVVTLDIGNYINIHPANKQDVGKRLAGLALANDYGKGLVASGPLYKSHQIEKSKMILDFDFTGTGLISREAMLTGFEIAGADKKFVPAKAVIKNNKVYLSSEKITRPMYARYAWSDKGLGNLMNKEGLPASSFTTECSD